MRSGIEATSPAVGFVALRADRDEHPRGPPRWGLQPAHDFPIAGQYAKGLQPIANRSSSHLRSPSEPLNYEGDLGGIYLYPFGTTDYNLASAPPFETSHVGSNDKQEDVVTVPRTGSMPVDFAMNDGCYPLDALDPSANGIHPGPYDFTAYVEHAFVGAPSGLCTPMTIVVRCRRRLTFSTERDRTNRACARPSSICRARSGCHCGRLRLPSSSPRRGSRVNEARSSPSASW